MWTKIFIRANNPLVRVSLTLQKRKAINNKASRRQCWIPNAIAGWAVLLNSRICVFRDLSHGSCLFFPPSPNCQLYQWWKWKIYHSKLFFCLHFLNCTLSSENESPLSFFFFFSQKYVSVRFLHYQSTGATRRKKTGCREITIQQPFFFKELTRCSKV